MDPTNGKNYRERSRSPPKKMKRFSMESKSPASNTSTFEQSFFWNLLEQNNRFLKEKLKAAEDKIKSQFENENKLRKEFEEKQNDLEKQLEKLRMQRRSLKKGKDDEQVIRKEIEEKLSNERKQLEEKQNDLEEQLEKLRKQLLDEQNSKAI